MYRSQSPVDLYLMSTGTGDTKSMQCSNPVSLPQGPVGCGQCMSCRINKGRLWTGRILLELETQSLPSWFVTLTYDPQHLPVTMDQETGEVVATLRPVDGENYRKRLQKVFGGQRRFFWVGEYGDKTERPHYHACFFGIPVDQVDQVVRPWEGGYYSVAEMTPQRAAYLAHYTTKKMTKADDPRLGVRHPEYAQMSRRPALGDVYVAQLGQWLTTRKGAAWLSAAGDVPQSFRTHGKVLPLGRRHQMMLRAICGMPELRTEVKRMAPERFIAPEFPTNEERRRLRQKEVQIGKRKAIFRKAAI